MEYCVEADRKLRGDVKCQDEDDSRIVEEWASERWIDRTVGTALRSQGGKISGTRGRGG